MYIPKKIICGICLPDSNKIQIENKVPHITMFIGEWAAKYSNFVLEELLETNKNLLEREFLVKKEEYAEMKNVFIKQVNCEESVFFIKGKETLCLEGTTGAFY